MKKKMFCLTMAFLMMAQSPAAVAASPYTEEQLLGYQAWTSAQLDATYARMDALWAQKQQLQREISALDETLVQVMVNIEVLNSDIASKQEDIEKTGESLQKAVNAKTAQYNSMKERIQYLYEKGGDDAWFMMLLNADDVADLLTKAEYTQKMYDADRKSLKKYVNTIKQVKNLQNQYESEKADLEEMELQLEEHSKELENQIEIRKQSSANCDAEIAYAQQQANDYAALLMEQQMELEKLAAERAAAEEAARREAEAYAAAQAAAEEAQYDEQYTEESGSGESTESVSGGDVYEGEVYTESYTETVYDENGEVVGETTYTTQYNAAGDVLAESSTTGEYDEDGDLVGSTTTGTLIDEDGYVYESEDSGSYDESGVSYYTDDSGSGSSDGGSSDSGSVEYDEYGNVIDSDNTVTDYDYSSSSSSSSGSGSSVVDYATQFVGNPYVWGGTSLTNGADCSGFVQSVYANFGVSLPRTSYEQQNAGYEVSYEDAQPGDLICYGGHVAIYMGDGKIVHASNSRDGIKISNDATYRTILSVRRLL